MKLVKFGVSGHFLENPMRKWPAIWHADVSWPPSELIRLWLEFVDFSNFGAILTKWNGSNLRFPGILVVLCRFSSLWWPFIGNWSYLRFLGIIWGTCGSKCRGGRRQISDALCRVLSSYFYHYIFIFAHHERRARDTKASGRIIVLCPTVWSGSEFWAHTNNIILLPYW